MRAPEPLEEAESYAPGTVLEPVCRGLSVLIPVLVTALRASGAPAWRSDLPIVRALGITPIGGEGAVTTILGQGLLLLPIGSRPARLAWVGAAAAGLAGYALYRLLLRWLSTARHSPRLSPSLSLSASLAATLGPSFQAEGTAAGGAVVAASLALAGLLVYSSTTGTRQFVATGALLGLATAESHAAGLALGISLPVATVLGSRLPSLQNLAIRSACAAVVLAFSWSPLWLRTGQEQPFLQMGVTWLSMGITGSAAPAPLAAPMDSWMTEAGPLLLGLAAAGLVLGLLSRKLRPFCVLLVGYIAADACFGGAESPVVTEPMACLRLLALAAVSCGAAMAVHRAALWLLSARVPMAEPAAVLMVVFHLTLAIATADRAVGRTAESQLAAEVWTDEALGQLPQDSLLLVRTQPLAFRLWAARLLRGERPDVVVVPLPLLPKGTLAASLIAEERALLPLIRDVSMNGKPGEFALSSLADSRPVYVELDRQWDRRLLAHLRPTPLWLGFEPHPLARSDRTDSLGKSRRAFHRVVQAALRDTARDEATLWMLGASAKEQALALAAVGDRDNARRVLSDLRLVGPELPLVAALEEQLGTGRGRVDLRSLPE